MRGLEWLESVWKVISLVFIFVLAVVSLYRLAHISARMRGLDGDESMTNLALDYDAIILDVVTLQKRLSEVSDANKYSRIDTKKILWKVAHRLKLKGWQGTFANIEQNIRRIKVKRSSPGNTETLLKLLNGKPEDLFTASSKRKDISSTKSILRPSAECFNMTKEWKKFFAPRQFEQSFNSTQCLSACEKANFSVAALEISADCRCGNFTSLKRGIKVNDTFCEERTGNFVKILTLSSVDKSCESRKFLHKSVGRLVALASYPGSGNTWTRHLLESATGIYTGSVYTDNQLYWSGFSGEMQPWDSHRTSAVKTHMFFKNQFEEAILVIRNPYDAVMAEFNRIRAGHTGHAEPELFRTMEWTYFTALGATEWYKIIKNYSTLEKLLVIFFEDMVKDPIMEVKKMAEFLKYPIPNLQRRLNCLERNIKGQFKRRKKKLPFDPYEQQSKDVVNSCIKSARKLLETRNLPSLPKYER